MWLVGTTAFALLVLASGTSGLWASGGSQQEAVVSGGPDYVGSQSCFECHDEEYESYRKSIHFQTETGDKWEVSACETCHGPGAEHVRAEGDTPMMFGSSQMYTVEQKLDSCLSCHAENRTSFEFRSADHVKGSVECSTCHKTHKGARYDKLLASLPGARTDALDFRAGQEACLQCHQEIRTSINLNERHRINEGMVQCADCHNQHGPSTRTHLGGFKYETCVECHTDKQGPWVFEHLSNRVEGCTACHANPHGSVNRHMLTYQKVAELCYGCHVVVPGFHKGSFEPGVVRFGNDAQCTNCHSTIHGSNISEFFLR